MAVTVTTEWLRDFVEFDLAPGDVAEKLTAVGLAVDSVTPLTGYEIEEAVLELDLTSNRGDCWSVLGVARELAAALGKKVRPPKMKPRTAGRPAKVEVRAPDLCPRYTARVIRDVKIGPSPEWMQRRLEAVGIRPISNVVDITNYVLIEMGQPMHAFDVSLLAGGRIVVRRARDGEQMELIDGTVKTLTAEDLVIADAERPVALAGVMGGANTEIRESTESVLLESAQFNPLSTRRTRKTLGVETESSVRFEHGVDPVGVELASRRAAYLLAEHAGGKVAPGVTDSNPKAYRPPKVRLRHSRIARLLGCEVPDADARRILKSLGFAQASAKKSKGEVVTVWTVPSWRQDVWTEVDLIEEVARVYGYDRLAGRATMRVFPVKHCPAYLTRKKAREVLTGLGYTEIVGASFFSPDKVRMAGEPGHVVRNPARAEEGMLRTSLLPSLLAAKRANENAGRPAVALFEVAPVCLPGKREPKELLAAVCDGRPDVAYGNVKGVLERTVGALAPGMTENVVDSTGRVVGRNVGFILRSKDDEKADVLSLDLAPIGAIGLVDRELVSKWDLKNRPAYLELHLDELVKRAGGPVQARDLPRFPAIARVVTLDLPESVTWERIEKEAAKLPQEWRSEPRFVPPVFKDKSKLGAYDKAITLRVEYRAGDRTLTDEDVKAPHEEFVAKLCAALGAAVRT